MQGSTNKTFSAGLQCEQRKPNDGGDWECGGGGGGGGGGEPGWSDRRRRRREGEWKGGNELAMGAQQDGCLVAFAVWSGGAAVTEKLNCGGIG